MTRSSPREQKLNKATNRPVVALVVAAGSGVRLGAAVPKALVELGGMSLVRRSVLAMRSGGVGTVVVTVPDGQVTVFEAALTGIDDVVCTLGGPERQDSVRLGLQTLAELVPDDAVVLVHDAARPLVPAEVVRAVAAAVADGADVVIPVVPVHDSIRQVNGEGSAIVDRGTLRAIQTPQGARLGALLAAHQHVHRNRLVITDDASALEAVGCAVTLVPGHHDSLKITEKLDLALAQGILDGRQEGGRL